MDSRPVTPGEDTAKPCETLSGQSQASGPSNGYAHEKSLAENSVHAADFEGVFNHRGSQRFKFCFRLN